MINKIKFSSEELVQGIYKALLERNFDKVGLENNLVNLNDYFNCGYRGEDLVEKILRDFKGSAEFRNVFSNGNNVFSHENMQQEILRNKQVFLGKNFHKIHINSLGFHCYTSSLLKNFGLRQWSGPFDWIFSTPEMVDFCFSDNFETFVNSKYLEEVPLKDRCSPEYNRSKHILFQEKFNISDPIFNHLDAHTVEGKEYLVRCIERLSHELSTGSRKMFLQVVHDNISNTENFFKNYSTLEQCSNSPIFLRVVVKRKNTDLPCSRFEFSERKSKSYACCNMYPTSEWLATSFEDTYDDLTLARFIYSFFLGELN